MEYQSAEVTISELHCDACSAIIKEEDFFCQNCGFPIKAPGEERDAFINDRNFHAFELTEMQKKIKNASTSIFVISGFTAAAAVVIYFMTPETQNPLALMIINLVVAGIFLGLGFWCKKQPVAAIISFADFVEYELLRREDMSRRFRKINEAIEIRRTAQGLSGSPSADGQR